MLKKTKLVLFTLFMVFLTAGFLTAAGSQDDGSVKENSTELVERGSEFHEAPLLHDMVLAGTLPPLEDRIPEKPYVEKVISDIGIYGGTMRRAWKGPGDKWGPAKLAEEFLVKFHTDGMTVVPNVAESFDVIDNGREYVFHLRKGLKWSDGVPFTAEDITFYWDHVITKELYKGIQDCFFVDGELCTVRKEDDYTVRVTFSKPSPRFLQNLVFQVREFYAPTHYLKKILPEFIGDDKALEMVKTQGYADIKSYLKNKIYYFWIHEDVPSLRAWVPVNDNTSNRWIMKRNPYYFKVDNVGNQLPYIDEIVHEFVEDNSVIALKAIAGELDMQFRHLDGDAADNFTLYMENQEKGGYSVLQMVNPMGSKDAFYLNQYHKDPVLREIFRDVRFRRAFSSALNREEIKEIAYSGFGEIRQSSIAPGMAYYSPEWEKAYTAYDKELANKLLDEMGLKWDSNHKYRLRPDGEILEILLQNDRTYTDAIVLAANDLEAVGIKAVVKTMERSLLEELRDNNDLDCGVWGYEGVSFMIDHSSMIPLTRQNYWAGMGGRYVELEGESGEPLFGDIQKVVDKYLKIQSTTDQEKIDRLAEEIVELHTKNIWAIGMVGLLPSVGVINNRIGNVAYGMYDYDALRNQGVLRPWQMYFMP